MLKGSLKILLVLLVSCDPGKEQRELEAYEQHLNTEAEKIIDAAYISIKQECDSLVSLNVKRVMDSIAYTTKRKK